MKVERVVLDNGTISYRMDDTRLHRANGPAKIWEGRTWHWCLYGASHRYYGPASWMGFWYIKGVEINKC